MTAVPLGMAVTTPRHPSGVVTIEWGAAELPGRTERGRTEALIAIAHPAVRDPLHAAATELPDLPDGDA